MMIEPRFTNRIPSSYFEPCICKGMVETINYRVPVSEGAFVDKHANVYLPFSYDCNQNYNVLYLLHGWTGNAEDYLNTSDCCQFRNILDHMIFNGDANPLIVVSPTWDVDNKEKDWDESCDEIRLFWKEYVNYLIPVIENSYSTYYNKKDIGESRKHRAVGGFSLGAIATWYIFQNVLQSSQWYIPMCSECWTSNENYDSDPEDTISKLYQYIGEVKEDFLIYMAIGTRDSRLKYLEKQIKCMEHWDMSAKERLALFYKKNGYHAYSSTWEYLYNIIPYIFEND